MIFLCAFLFSALSVCAQDSEWQPGNQFSFAVGLEYDVEPEVISSGVGQALEDWTGNASDITNQTYTPPPPVWTNYDTNGLPPEIFGRTVEGQVKGASTNLSSMGFRGISDIMNSSASSNSTEVVLPYVSGKGADAQPFKTVQVIYYPNPSTPIPSTRVRQALGYANMEAGWFRDLWGSVCDAVSDLLDSFQQYGVQIRNIIVSLCTTLAALHLLWATAVVGSAIFRAFVAGLTGVGGGGK